MEEGAEEVDVVAAADDDVSTMLLCVMKRSRSFMAGRKVMMIFSTWGIKKPMYELDERFLLKWLFFISIFYRNLTCSFTLSPVYMYLM